MIIQVLLALDFRELEFMYTISGFQDHATFRKRGAKHGALILCNHANFGHLSSLMKLDPLQNA